jgi:hypothetical protein
MSGLLDLIEEAQDLGKYDEDGALAIFSRPENDIDLKLSFEGRWYIGEASDGNLNIRHTGRSSLEAVRGALGGLLDALEFGLGAKKAA